MHFQSKRKRDRLNMQFLKLIERKYDAWNLFKYDLELVFIDFHPCITLIIYFDRIV